ncbi:MAG: DNA translocase FtsK [Lawsonibacter sp.]|nr:DNA translocase FtsK [Lawsonibacter sp.]
MATTQRKTGGKRTSGKRAAPSRAKSAPKGPPQGQPFRREAGAAVCLLLAVFTFFGWFRMKAIFIDFFCSLLRGLIGYGFWLTPPAFLLAAWILAFHRGRPVAVRVTCALLLPLTFAGLFHGLLCPALPWDGYLMGSLWESGQVMKSGGLAGGVLAQSFVSLFTVMGCSVVFGMAAILMGLAAFDRSLIDIADWIFNRPEYDYEPEPQREQKPKAKPSPRREPAKPHGRAPSAPELKRTHTAIDIPVDDVPPVRQEPEPEPAEKRSLFDKKPRVPTPDQVLISRRPEPVPEPESAPVLEEELEPEVPAASAVLVEAPAAPPPPLPEPEPEPAAPSNVVPFQPRPEPAPKAEKLTLRQEAEEAAAQMAQDIQSTMTQNAGPYPYPPLSLLREGSGDIGGEALGELSANQRRLGDTLHSFGIDATIHNVVRGPSVTRYELELDQGVRLNKLTNLSDDIALALGAPGVRVAAVPGKQSTVGIEVPNQLVSPVNIREVLASPEFQNHKSKVAFAVGKDINGSNVVGSIADLTHMLIAGTTGSGKSVCTNSLIISLLYKAAPDEVRLIMVDPKMVELGIYNGIPHLLIPVVTDPKKAAGALQWAVNEMMKRYQAFSELGVRDLASYNARAAQTEGLSKLPSIVVVIDELADLMLVAAKEVEDSICRVAQMGRAAGMHLVIATQRPSADVITGLMKANIPSRIAFAVASAMESRIILDNSGAEKLVGRGDMLYQPRGSKPQRTQGCFISDDEVAAVVSYVKQGSTAQYDDAVMREIEQRTAEKDKGSKGAGVSAEDAGEYDELIDAAAEVVVETGQASVSMLQRRLKLGYSRAARLVDQLEDRGIVGPFEGSKPRQLLITKEQWQEMKYRQGIDTPPLHPAEEEPPAPEALDRAEEDTL